MDSRPARTKEVTPTLRTRSPTVHRQRERVVGFEEVPNREGSRTERNTEGNRTLKARAEENVRPVLFDAYGDERVVGIIVRAVRMCIDYGELSKIDLYSGCHQMRVHEEEIPKTEFRTPYGHFSLHKVKGRARVIFEDEFGAADEREVLCEAQQGRSGVKRKLFRNFRNKMGNEPILALPEGPDNFVVIQGLNMRHRRWMELFSEYSCETKYHMGKANIVVDTWRRKGGVKPRRVQDICRMIQAEIIEKMFVTDGQSERIFLMLENMFRVCVRNLVVVGILTFHEAEIGESKMIGLELEQETTKVVVSMERLKEAKDLRFGKKGELAPRHESEKTAWPIMVRHKSEKKTWPIMDNDRGYKSRDMFSPYRGANHGLLSNLSNSPREILATKKVAKTFEQPPWLPGRGEIFNIEHRVNESKHVEPVKQKKRSLAPKRNEESHTQMEELTKANILQEVKYQTWVSNPVIAKNADERWKGRDVLRKSHHKVRNQGMSFKSQGNIRIGADKTLPFMRTLKNCTSGKMVQWTTEADKAFQRMKELLEALPIVTASVNGETMIVQKKGPEPENAWKLFNDGALSSDGSRVGLMMVNPKGKEYTCALRFEFETNNNEVEYEALLAGLRIAKEMKIQELIIFVDSQLVANQVNGLFEARQPVIKKYMEKAKELLANFPKVAKEVLVEVLQEKSITQTRSGVPQIVVSDNRKQFAEGTFPIFCKKNLEYSKPSHHSTTPKQTELEVTNREVVKGMECRLRKTHQGWVDELPQVLWAHKTALKSSNRETPFSLVYGSKAIVPIEISVDTRRIQDFNPLNNEKRYREDLDILKEKREIASIKEAHYKQKLEKYYNKRVRPSTFKLGTYVL
uniref:Reverse transcriptase domain-containing protein n=1 Tax=Tanacetum cinerariifolium TaxID=118510 RepID=A0A699GPJ6_TANCI|nr:reverse transcriptase domain-containing protein [Tanacetum cinerariifolium]